MHLSTLRIMANFQAFRERDTCSTRCFANSTLSGGPVIFKGFSSWKSYKDQAWDDWFSSQDHHIKNWVAWTLLSWIMTILAPVSSCRALIVSPPFPIMRATRWPGTWENKLSSESFAQQVDGIENEYQVGRHNSRSYHHFKARSSSTKVAPHRATTSTTTTASAASSLPKGEFIIVPRIIRS